MPPVNSTSDPHSDSPNDANRSPQVPWQPRFSLQAMFLVMFVLCCVAAGGHYLVKSLTGGVAWRLAFVLFTLASPMLIMVVLSIVRSMFEPAKRRRR